MDEIRILQLGDKDWNEIYSFPGEVKIEHCEAFTETPKAPYDIVFLDRAPLREELEPLYRGTKAYSLFVTEQVKLKGDSKDYFERKKGKRIRKTELEEFLQKDARFFYPRPYGEKFRLWAVAIAQGFSGSVKWNGDYSVELQGEYGKEFRQIVYWRNNIPVFQGQMLDLWLEYKKDPEVELALSITKFASGSISDVIESWEFREKDLNQIVQIDNRQRGWLFVSLRAKGRGKLQVMALHDRFSRGKYGHFLPGGERYVTSGREEIFCYFNPGDRKPPLNVFFSGYKTKQGFEGYYMMEGMGAPYLLVAEPRLEGGSFYMGSEEYEQKMVDMIRRYMNELGFSSHQLIMAGLSMGTYGAMYYGCDLQPHAIILGKPLASVGNIAKNLRLQRPGSFDTSLDVLRYLSGNTDKGAVQKLNDRFWEKFDAANWEHSKFAVAYMIEDDYDSDAYNTLISHLASSGVQVYGKGLHGRHNDNSGGIVNWFASQYKKILREDFGRVKRD
ncbi:MAG: accessory Sec system protein Asp2 [Lachnospiraceae bacterium]|nr:accessory Sec system protein Asp2 [uncultured Acetatifactor sp.]MCI9220368.1 accessory Sec system protein Asp2 [Lachnospiraceae bacterium]